MEERAGEKRDYGDKDARGKVGRECKHNLALWYGESTDSGLQSETDCLHAKGK